VARLVRATHNVLIAIITAKISPDDRVYGLENADDYIVQPFDLCGEGRTGVSPSASDVVQIVIILFLRRTRRGWTPYRSAVVLCCRKMEVSGLPARFGPAPAH